MKAFLSFLLLSAITAQASHPSPAQNAIAAAREQIQKNPKQSQGYNDLAKALVRRARETGDPD
jgi:cytochrome c-type biogenesis protein CcmH/NrfG